MKRVNFSRMEIMQKISFNNEVGLKHVIMYQPSPVDEFYMEECHPSDDTIPSYSFVDPIIMLFNQERIDDLGSMAAKTYLDSMIQKPDSALAELRKKCSDDDLLSMVKSRHLQSPAEILSWCRYMQSNVDEFNNEVSKLLAQKEDQKEDEVSKSVTTETPDTKVE